MANRYDKALSDGFAMLYPERAYDAEFAGDDFVAEALDGYGDSHSRDYWIEKGTRGAAGVSKYRRLRKAGA